MRSQIVDGSNVTEYAMNTTGMSDEAIDAAVQQFAVEDAEPDPTGYLAWLAADPPATPPPHEWCRYRAQHRQRNPQTY